jgi:DNA-binding XRE family transcriptional regulator
MLYFRHGQTKREEGSLRLDADEVRQARERLGYTTREAARISRLSENTYLRAEHDREITPPTARKIAEAFGLKVADLYPKAEAPPKALPHSRTEERRNDKKVAYRREAAKAFRDINDDFRQELDALKPEGNAAKLQRLFRRAAAARTGAHEMASPGEADAFVFEEQPGEGAEEREALNEIRSALVRLEGTVEDIWNAYESAKAQGLGDEADNVVVINEVARRKTG